MTHVHGGDIYSNEVSIDFSANINYRGMPDSVRESAVRAVGSSMHYPDPGYKRLREALAVRESRIARLGCDSASCGSGIGCEWIIPGNGAAELLFAAARAEAPQKALLASPSFFEYEQSLRAAGCSVCRFPLSEENGFSLGDGFAASLTPDIDMVILGNPNNPTGRIIEFEVLRHIVRECGRMDVLLVLDESFLDFVDIHAPSGSDCEGTASMPRTFSGAGIVAKSPRVFVIKSFTKMYAIPGLRFGYGICSDSSLIAGMREITQPWNVSLPAEAAAIAASKELDFARETRESIAEARSFLADSMRRLGIEVMPSDANFLLFKGPANLRDLCLKRGLLIRDCSNFPGLAASGGRGWFRTSVRSKEENGLLLDALSSFCK